MSTDDAEAARLRSAVEAVAAHAETIVVQAEWERDNRRGLLWVHALVGVIGGFQMALYGTAFIIEHTYGVGARYVVAVTGMVGGLILIAGLVRRPRHVTLETAGLVVLGIWDAILGAAFTYTRATSNFVGDVLGITEVQPPPPGYVNSYPATIYLGLFALICIHLLTLRRLKKVRSLL